MTDRGELSASRVVEHLRAALEPAGLDIVHPFPLDAYNRWAHSEPSLRPLPTFDRERPLAVLIGNTRSLWPPLVAAYRRPGALRDSSNPVERYTAERTTEAAATLDVATLAYFAHDTGDRLVPMVRVAEVSGFARPGPTGIAVHPQLGMWFAMRAVLVVDFDFDVAVAVGANSSPTAADAHPCEGCAAPCLPAFDRATSSIERDGDRAVERNWRDWLAVRDACPVGVAHRYDDAQIRYHYTKDRRALVDPQGRSPTNYRE